MEYLWIKTFHIVFVISWFAGLFYLPRIYVNLAMLEPQAHEERARLLLMAAKLFRFMQPLMWLALGLGLWLWLGYGVGLGTAWMHAKLALIALLIGYHLHCGHVLRRFREGSEVRSHRWFRWYNEAPVLLLVAAVALVVVKPWGG